MTMVEIAYASKSALLPTGLMGPSGAVIPAHLERFWAAHQHLLVTTPRGQLSHADFQKRVYALAKAELHHQAVTACAASTAAQAFAVNSGIYGVDPLSTPHLQRPESQAAPLQPPLHLHGPESQAAHPQPPSSTCPEAAKLAPAPIASPIQQILRRTRQPHHTANSASWRNGPICTRPRSLTRAA